MRCGVVAVGHGGREEGKMEAKSAGTESMEGQSPARPMIVEEASVQSINAW